MGRSVVTSIRIDEDVLREAKALGLNVSKICENALKEAIRRLKGEPSHILNSRNSDDPPSEGMVLRSGFEPAFAALEASYGRSCLNAFTFLKKTLSLWL